MKMLSMIEMGRHGAATPSGRRRRGMWRGVSTCCLPSGRILHAAFGFALVPFFAWLRCVRTASGPRWSP